MSLTIVNMPGQGLAVSVTPGPGQEPAVAVVPAEELLDALMAQSPEFVAAVGQAVRRVLQRVLDE